MFLSLYVCVCVCNGKEEEEEEEKKTFNDGPLWVITISFSLSFTHTTVKM